MLIIIGIALPLVTFIFFYLRHPQFGKKAKGLRWEKMNNSPHFINKRFENLNHTPELTEGYTYAHIIFNLIFKKNKRGKPVGPIPSIKTDLMNLPIDLDVLVWFGHSSYYLKIQGLKILVDPVFSGNASPVPGSNRAFQGTDQYKVMDLPEIDCLLITHDHYDHLDYETIRQLKPKKVICGLGVGAHFEHWGYAPHLIMEMDWNEKIEIGKEITVFSATARHFSGRGFSRSNTLWLSFIIQTPTLKLYLGGDSGYDTHFVEIGQKYGPFDLVILENGQYDPAWIYLHATPKEVLQAARDLKAKRLMPVHSSKFSMANHSWDDPLNTITVLNENYNIPLVTPMIGEVVHLENKGQIFKDWWRTIA
jgi:L-ascorbate metabolism protein UlaG (beta-lactamase superfamily)